MECKLYIKNPGTPFEFKIYKKNASCPCDHIEVDFGDGISSSLGDLYYINHTYNNSLLLSIAQVIEISIVYPDNIKSLPLDFSDNPYIVSVDGVLPNLEITKKGIFENCINLQMLGSDILKNNPYRLDRLLYGCKSFTSLEYPNFFCNSSNEKTARETFMNSGLSEIHLNAMIDLLSLENITSCFENTHIKNIPLRLFDNMNSLKIATRLFYNCNELTTVGKTPFAKNRMLSDLRQAFEGCTKLILDHNFNYHLPENCIVD